MTSTSKKLQNYVQYVCAFILTIYAIFRIGIPLVMHQPLYLDTNDGYMIIGCLAMILAIEGVKKYLNKKVD